LTPDQQAAFAAGRAKFAEVETVADGLGPVFNGTSCGECHAHPALGGSSPDLGTSVEFRIGTLTSGAYDPLVEYGGPVLQRRSIKEFEPACPIEGERVPPQATLVSQRITPMLFGDGLIEAIPDEEILQQRDAQSRGEDGVSGKPNFVFNPETGRLEIGRFGWKAHDPTLHLFAGDAYLNEMGITNPTFPNENLPQGQPIPPEWQSSFDRAGKLEDDGSDVSAFAEFMRFLAPPASAPITGMALHGQRLFAQIGCASCHVPAMTTGDNPVAALRFQTVAIYSDLLLHDMGPGLADGIVMGSATGSQWRTTPLWGLAQRNFFIHDGRATTLPDAILAHGGEAQAARTRFVELNPTDRQALLAFLASL
jgi:CxxC motif-containing protein (DUF1111 family)